MILFRIDLQGLLIYMQTTQDAILQGLLLFYFYQKIKNKTVLILFYYVQICYPSFIWPYVMPVRKIYSPGQRKSNQNDRNIENKEQWALL